MGDVERIILKEIKPSILELSKKKIGRYDSEDKEGIHYIFDSNEYLISVKKVQN